MLPRYCDVPPQLSVEREIWSEKRVPTDHSGWHLNMVVAASSTGKLAETRLRAAHSDVSRRHQDCHPRAPLNSRRRPGFFLFYVMCLSYHAVTGPEHLLVL